LNFSLNLKLNCKLLINYRIPYRYQKWYCIFPSITSFAYQKLAKSPDSKDR